MQKLIPVYLGGLSGNCYILQNNDSIILVDTGSKSKLKQLEQTLRHHLINIENITLILITHGDFDHTGNCACFQKKYKIRIAIHEKDAGMIEKNDMFWNRKSGAKIVRIVLNAIFGIKKCTPDLKIQDGFNLNEFGINAKTIHIPGHSAGSIGILTNEGDFICGDIFENTKKPKIGSIIDNKTDAEASIAMIKKLGIKRVFPGHGRGFEFKELDL